MPRDLRSGSHRVLAAPPAIRPVESGRARAVEDSLETWYWPRGTRLPEPGADGRIYLIRTGVVEQSGLRTWAEGEVLRLSDNRRLCGCSSPALRS